MKLPHNKYGQRTGMTPEEFAEMRAQTLKVTASKEKPQDVNTTDANENVSQKEESWPPVPNQVVCNYVRGPLITPTYIKPTYLKPDEKAVVSSPSSETEATSRAKGNAKFALILFAVGIALILIAALIDYIRQWPETKSMVFLAVIGGLIIFVGVMSLGQAVFCLFGSDPDEDVYCSKCHVSLNLWQVPTDSSVPVKCPHCGTILRGREQVF